MDIGPVFAKPIPPDTNMLAIPTTVFGAEAVSGSFTASTP
jgi:hypothetical protein